MKVQTVTLDEASSAKREGKGAFAINIDGKCVFTLWEGEPEDMCLWRDLSDVLNIPALMKMAYDAGVAGEKFDLEATEANGEDMPWSAT